MSAPPLQADVTADTLDWQLRARNRHRHIRRTSKGSYRILLSTPTEGLGQFSDVLELVETVNE
jgi:hypothetical protein